MRLPVDRDALRRIDLLLLAHGEHARQLVDAEPFGERDLLEPRFAALDGRRDLVVEEIQRGNLCKVVFRHRLFAGAAARLRQNAQHVDAHLVVLGPGQHALADLDDLRAAALVRILFLQRVEQAGEEQIVVRIPLERLAQQTFRLCGVAAALLFAVADQRVDRSVHLPLVKVQQTVQRGVEEDRKLRQKRDIGGGSAGFPLADRL